MSLFSFILSLYRAK